MGNSELENVIKFFSEIYMLKRNKHEGFRLAGVEKPDSLADHVAIAAQLAYIIAEMEGLDGKTCATMTLFHDNGEARITDQHKVAAQYIDNAKSEQQAFEDQMDFLPETIKEKIKKLYLDCEQRLTAEGVVAKDADLLETALQAKIYTEQGYDCTLWIENATRAIETKTGKLIMEKIKDIDNLTSLWWQGLKKDTYKHMKK